MIIKPKVITVMVVSTAITKTKIIMRNKSNSSNNDDKNDNSNASDNGIGRIIKILT